MPGEDSGIGAAPRGGASSSTNMQSPQRPNRRGGGVNSSDSTYSGRGGSQGRSNRGRGGTTGSGRGIGQGHNSGRGVDAEHGQGPATNEGGQRKRGGRGRHSGGSGGKGEQVGNGTLEAASMAKGVDPARLPTRRDALLRPPADRSGGSGGEDGADDDAEVCFICANPVIHHSITPCNHLTCHICALRMRALYRNKDCPHCRTLAPYVVFTDDPAKHFEDYKAADITSTDDSIGIKYTNEDIVGDTVLLLRYNCPDESCDYAGLGWPDLHRHVRSVHHKKMCDLCTRYKKLFTHEHELLTDRGLERHMRHGDDKPGAVDQTGFKGHPLCSFCGERFYDDDKLYEHCRNKHERCFICDRRDSRQPHYYRNYNELEKHFSKDHFLCLDRECLEKKFCVFESELDLKAHQLSEHGNSLSKDVRRDVQVVSMSDFDFRPAYQGGSGRSHQGRPGRGRDPNADAPAPSTLAQNMRRDEIAFQRQLAIHSAQSISNRTFGSHLSHAAPTPAQSAASGSSSATAQNGSFSSSTATAARSVALASSDRMLFDPMEPRMVADLANLSPQDRARLVRHGAVLERASNLLGSNPAKISEFRSHISSYRSGKWSAVQLIDAFSNLFNETSDTALGSLVREVADLFDDPEKADALRKALNDRRVVQEDYPSLPTLGGMHGATTSTSGWAAAAAASPSASGFPNTTSTAQAQSSTRVLRLKHSTRLGGGGSSGVRNSIPSSTGPAGRIVPGATWTSPSRPAILSVIPIRTQASGPASAAFPALPTVSKKAAPTVGSSTWAAGALLSTSTASSLAARVAGGSNGSRGGPSTSTTGSGANTPRQAIGEDAFPALPAAPKPPIPGAFSYGQRPVRRDFGTKQDTGFSWGGDSNGGGSKESAGEPGAVEDEDDGSAKGKKKGRQGKKVLVQWG